MMDMKNSAFTLIELIVVIAVIALLSGMSLVTYTQFNVRQSALNDVRNFETELRKVQAMAKNLVYPIYDGNRCDGLVKYNVKSDKSGASCSDCQSISAYAVCNSGEILVVNQEKIFSKAYFSDSLNIDIEPGTGSFTKNYVFSLENINDMEIKTDENGNISVQ